MKPVSTSCIILALGVCAISAGQSADSDLGQPSSTDDDVVFTLSPFFVNAESDRGYSATSTLGASRVAMSITDIPTSVISLNEQVFQDRAAVDGMEVLTLVSGVQQGADGSPGQAGFSLRGYSVSGLRIRDGLPETLEGVDYAFDDAAAYERLEVIKGPAGTLYGTSSMGGVVNKISKWPRFVPETKIELQAQTGDEFGRVMVDTTGPVGEKNAYRAVLSVRRGDRYYDEADAPNDFTNSMLAFTHRIGESGNSSGKIWARAQYFTFDLDREGGPQFLTGWLDSNSSEAPVISDPVFGTSIDSNVEPEDDISSADIYAFEGGYEQTFKGPFDGNWTMRLVSRYSEGQGDKSPTYAVGRPIPVDGDGQVVQYENADGEMVDGDNRHISANDPRVVDWRAPISLRNFDGHKKGGGMFLDLVGDFQTGGLRHQLVLNGQLQKSEHQRAFFFWTMPNEDDPSEIGNSFSLLNPDFSDFSPEAVKAASPTNFNPFQGNSESNSFAVGFQDNISMLENRLIFVLGARYDNIHTTNYSFDREESIAQLQYVPDFSSTNKTQNQEWTYKYGIVGKPIRGLSVFAQIGETYIPVTSVDSEGNKWPNQLGEIREVGIKTDTLEGRLVATASFFDMELTNVLVSVPNPPELGGGLVLAPAGTQETDGFELDLSYSPIDALDLSLGYSKLDSTNAAGNYFRGVPRDGTWSTLGKYRFLEGNLAGLFTGVVWKHGGSFAGDSANSFYIDNSDVFDGFIGYGKDRWTLQLNIMNLTDTDDIITTVNDTAAFRAQERSYRLTFRYSL